MSRKAEITSKLFVTAYLENGRNATQAYLTVFGGKHKTAEAKGSALLKTTRVVQLIEEALQRNELTADRVLEEIRRCALSNPEDYGYIATDGKFVLDLSKTKTEHLAAVAGFDYDAKGRQVMKMTDKLKALRMLAEYFKLLTAVSEFSGPGGSPLVPPVVQVNFKGKK